MPKHKPDPSASTTAAFFTHSANSGSSITVSMPIALRVTIMFADLLSGFMIRPRAFETA